MRKMRTTLVTKFVLCALLTALATSVQCLAQEVLAPVVSFGCADFGSSTKQKLKIAIVHNFADQLIQGLRQNDVPEFAKDWFFAGEIGFSRPVGDLLRNRGNGLYAALKGLGCKNGREMEWFMIRVVHLRLAKKSEPPREILELIREQLKNIDDAWKRAHDKRNSTDKK